MPDTARKIGWIGMGRMGFPMAEELGSSVHLTKGLISSTSGLKDDTKRADLIAYLATLH